MHKSADIDRGSAEDIIVVGPQSVHGWRRIELLVVLAALLLLVLNCLILSPSFLDPTRSSALFITNNKSILPFVASCDLSAHLLLR